MKRLIYLCIIGILTAGSLHASEKRSRLRADSIMEQVIRQAAVYQQVIDSYEAEIYLKGKTRVPKKNRLIRFAHEVFPVEHNPGDGLFEMSGYINYHAPNHYRNDIRAVNGNRLSSGKQYKEVFTFINLNVYSPTIYNKEIIMPLSPKAFKYYTFDLKDVETIDGRTFYCIRFTPRTWSQKLLSGQLYVTDRIWTVDRIEVEGHSSFSEFSLQLCFYRDEKHFALPKTADLQVRFHALGNVIENEYHSAFRYRSVAWVEENQEHRKQHPLDQTSYHVLSADTVPILRDTAYWTARRDLPLTDSEASAYSATGPKRTADTTALAPYIRLSEQLTSTIHMDYKTTRVKYSGLLNPFQLAYSGSNGITYRQQVRISKTFGRDRQLRFSPEIGYLFKKKELRFKAAADWEYLPERIGVLNFTLANENRSYPSTSHFNDLNLKYYHHYNFGLQNKIELTNGLLLHAGLSYHLRTPVKTHDEVLTTAPSHERFNDFTPTLGLTYTPRQYYWMDGYRKEYLYSHYPTFTFELARGIPGVLRSNSNYWRLEAGLFQSVKLGLSEKLSYNVSGGLFFNQHNTYFADFRYFAKRYFPEPWGDRFGGVFHNLAGEWYNASDKYIQGHLMYESPFILLRFIKPGAQKYIVSERFYLSQLWTPVRPNYSELGYGVGSDICNIALFLSFEEFRYQSIGVKFALELFR